MANRLVTLATFDTLAPAHIARNALSADGIRSELGDEFVVGLFGQLANAVGGVKLIVREENAENALNIVMPLVGGANFRSAAVVEEELTSQALELDPEVLDPTEEDLIAVVSLSQAGIPVVDREKAALMAIIFAGLGLIICPFQFLAVYYLFTAALSRGELSERGKQRLFVVAALLICFGVIGYLLRGISRIKYFPYVPAPG